jgi:hypothetical protein
LAFVRCRSRLLQTAGVGHASAAVASPSPLVELAPTRLWLPHRLGVGLADPEGKQAGANMRRANFKRRE